VPLPSGVSGLSPRKFPKLIFVQMRLRAYFYAYIYERSKFKVRNRVGMNKFNQIKSWVSYHYRTHPLDQILRCPDTRTPQGRRL